MLTIESIMSINKEDLPEASKRLKKNDISQLIKYLSLKDDNIRYRAFILLQNRSSFFDDVYPYWDTFRDKIGSDNSYQRSIGLMLIAENARWDTKNMMENTIDDFLGLLNDEKPITIRQCIQSLEKIALYKPDENEKIARRLVLFNIMDIKETMRKSILMDILNVLLVIRKKIKTDEIESYIMTALTGEILDKKVKKQIEAQL